MEENLNNKKEENVKHKRGSKVIFALAVIVAVALVLTLVTALVLLFFPVSDIEVVGDSRYTYSEIIDASGIKEGNRLYYLDEAKAEDAILKAFPYLKSVEIHSYFPNRVKIDIEEYEDIYLVNHTNGFCYVNSDFEILEIVQDAPSYERFTGVFIKLEKNVESEIGSFHKSEDAKRAIDLIEIIKKYGFYSELNIVDVHNKYDNAFVVGKKYKFVVGAMTDIAEKMDAAFKVVLSNSFEKKKNAVIDATDKKKLALRYVNDENIRIEFDFCQK